MSRWRLAAKAVTKDSANDQTLECASESGGRDSKLERLLLQTNLLQMMLQQVQKAEEIASAVTACGPLWGKMKAARAEHQFKLPCKIQLRAVHVWQTNCTGQLIRGLRQLAGSLLSNCRALEARSSALIMSNTVHCVFRQHRQQQVAQCVGWWSHAAVSASRVAEVHNAGLSEQTARLVADQKLVAAERQFKQALAAVGSESVSAVEALSAEMQQLKQQLNEAAIEAASHIVLRQVLVDENHKITEENDELASRAVSAEEKLSGKEEHAVVLGHQLDGVSRQLDQQAMQLQLSVERVKALEARVSVQALRGEQCDAAAKHAAATQHEQHEQMVLVVDQAEQAAVDLSVLQSQLQRQELKISEEAEAGRVLREQLIEAQR